MATKQTKKASTVKAAPVKKEIKEEVVETPIKKKAVSFDSTDVIECESITAGELIMVGAKSGNMYEWNDIGDVTEVEYRDLVAAVRSASPYINKPYFLIQNEDFLNEFPKVTDVYNALYSSRDLKNILRDVDASDLKSKIESLPDGAKTSLKHLASTMISNGQLDSVNKIKVLDEIFDAHFMLMTGLFNE